MIAYLAQNIRYLIHKITYLIPNVLNRALQHNYIGLPIGPFVGTAYAFLSQGTRLESRDQADSLHLEEGVQRSQRLRGRLPNQADHSSSQ